MKKFLAAAAIGAAATQAYAVDSTIFKTSCIWNATGETVKVQMEWDDLDPTDVIELKPASYFSYSWQMATTSSRTPPLKLWFQKDLAGTLDTTSTFLDPQIVPDERDCTKLRKFPLHYRVEEVYGANGAVTGFSLRGPIANP